MVKLSRWGIPEMRYWRLMEVSVQVKRKHNEKNCAKLKDSEPIGIENKIYVLNNVQFKIMFFFFVVSGGNSRDSIRDVKSMQL